MLTDYEIDEQHLHDNMREFNFVIIGLISYCVVAIILLNIMGFSVYPFIVVIGVALIIMIGGVYIIKLATVYHALYVIGCHHKKQDDDLIVGVYTDLIDAVYVVDAHED